MSRSGRNYNKKPPDIGLVMECHDEALTPEQTAAYNKGEKEFQEVQAKLEQLMKSHGAEIIEKSDNVYVVQMNSTSPPGPTPVLTATTPVTGKNMSPVPRQSAALIAQPPPATIQAIQTPTGSVILQAPTIQTRSTVHTRTSMRIQPAPVPVNQKITPVTPAMNATPTPVSQPMPTVPSLRIKTPKPPANQKTTPNAGKSPAGSNTRPTEGNSVGGLAAGPGSKPWKPAGGGSVAAPIVDLTEDDGKPSNSNVAADSREVTFNKLSGKTFPSLVVVARPHLRLKDMAQGTVSQERASLDSKVKSVLMFTPTKFTEWLIQQGLVRSEQYCTTHAMADNVTPIRLKLGMYSDVSKFPYSGGYVWISECCPQRFVSVFSGSIFEGAPHPPTVLLKLIYHWACQTNVQNVVQWVKVDNFYVKNFFTNMRSVCTAAIHEKYEKMGGLRKRVEVGVISLGTTSQDGNMRQVKVEVLGVMDPESKLIRLRAVEPLQEGERNYKRRFVKILEPLEQWVDKESIILTDFTVDKGTLHNMGFSTVYQVAVGETPSQNKYSNQNVMEYLRRIVPRMFQNTLSLLSRQIIQQFLDELVWREKWGPVPSQAFDNVIAHMAEQTKLDTSDSLLTRLSRVAANPFKLWQYSAWKTPPTPKTPIVTNGTSTSSPQLSSTPPPLTPTGPISSIDMLPQSIRTIDPPSGAQKRNRKRAAQPTDAPDAKKPATAAQSVPTVPEEQISLDSYYYGTLEGDAEIIKEEFKNDHTIKCCVCQRKYNNNIALMKHLIMHAQSDNQFNTELSDVTQCKYCLKSFPTPFSMQTHIEEIHLKTSNIMVCRICDEKFRDRPTLVTHMHRTHVAIELPYECGICKFRSSMHRDLIDHFYEVHNGGEKLQCPFCLKTVAFANHGKKMSANVNFFLNHIQKHQRKSIARKCNKCSMWFVHKGILKEHQIKDHSSFKGIPGVKPYVNSTGIEVMMPPPPISSNLSRPLAQKSKRMKTPPINYASRMFEPGLSINGVDDGSNCCECEGDMLGEEHFPGYLTCSRCRFATCCSKAMMEHNVVFHESGKATPQFTLGRMVQLPADMFCVCGYKTNSGNRLANHLARCERKSAYPSAARAKAATIQSASFPPLVTLDDADNASEDPSDRWLKAFVPSRKEDPGEGSRDAPDKKQPQQSGGDPPSMLNILGLVRKPSTDESSLDRAPSDSEGLPENKSEQPPATSEQEPAKTTTENETDAAAVEATSKPDEEQATAQEDEKMEVDGEEDSSSKQPEVSDEQPETVSEEPELGNKQAERNQSDKPEESVDDEPTPMDTEDIPATDDRASLVGTEENSQTSEVEETRVPSPPCSAESRLSPQPETEAKVPSPVTASETRISPVPDVTQENVVPPSCDDAETATVNKDSDEHCQDDEPPVLQQEERVSPSNEIETEEDTADSSVVDNDAPSLEPNASENVESSVRENVGPSLEENTNPSVEENAGPLSEENEPPSLEENGGPLSEENAAPSLQENASPLLEENTEASLQENVSPSLEENAAPSLEKNAGLSSQAKPEKETTETENVPADGSY